MFLCRLPVCVHTHTHICWLKVIKQKIESCESSQLQMIMPMVLFQPTEFQGLEVCGLLRYLINSHDQSYPIPAHTLTFLLLLNSPGSSAKTILLILTKSYLILPIQSIMLASLPPLHYVINFPSSTVGLPSVYKPAIIYLILK